ncbi:hypothetical protein C1646_693413 [Rhizophagus diaphanus]|nr:hypothetical protein C1646_693413 [Rhizophagus diaphanus] [Rhizophagus sp. MUCL 43196]
MRLMLNVFSTCNFYQASFAYKFIYLLSLIVIQTFKYVCSFLVSEQKGFQLIQIFKL